MADGAGRSRRWASRALQPHPAGAARARPVIAPLEPSACCLLNRQRIPREARTREEPMTNLEFILLTQTCTRLVMAITELVAQLRRR